MKASLKVLPVLGLTLLLASCTTGTTPTQDAATKTPVISPEMKELSDKMIKASSDLTVTQVIGNTAFKAYDKLTVKYGADAKNLTMKKEFSGKEGFVVLDGLKPSTEYTYEIYEGASRISIGTVRTQKK